MRWLVSFAVMNVVLLVVVLLTLWATGSFTGTGLSVDGWIALGLGIVFTSAVAIALMGLVFYSDRQEVDERVHHAADKDR